MCPSVIAVTVRKNSGLTILKKGEFSLYMTVGAGFPRPCPARDGYLLFILYSSKYPLAAYAIAFVFFIDKTDKVWYNNLLDIK